MNVNEAMDRGFIFVGIVIVLYVACVLVERLKK